MKKKLVLTLTIVLMFNLTGCSISSTNNNLKKKAFYHPEFVKKISIEDEYNTYKNIVGDKIKLDSNEYINKVCTLDGEICIDKYNPFGPSALIDITNNKIIHANNWNDRIYPASTTKIMTALLGLELGKLDDIVTVSKSIYNIDESSTVAGLCVGDKISFNNLLYAMMLPSGNDAAVMVAEYIAGNVDEFVNLMNKRALELGCTHTHFVNPNGLHDDNHYTTISDMYLIFNQAIKNETFLKIIGTNEFTFNIERGNGDLEIVCQNTNEFINGKNKSLDKVKFLGGKTGTTRQAGCCLIQLVNYNNCNYIEINMGVGIDDSEDGHETLYTKCKELLSLGLKI